MIAKYLIIYILVLLAIIAKGQVEQEKATDPTYPGRIILKIKPVYKSLCLEKGLLIAGYNDIIQANNGKINKIFPYAKPPATEKNRYGNKMVDLTTIYEINFDTTVTLQKIISKFNSFPETEYCQPVYLPELLYSPNDPGISAQYYLNNIKAYQAWNLCKGDSNIVIGITDTGVENAHEDLIDNIYYNYNDPINSIDDDHDGFIDNFRGWDIGNNDNSPEWDNGSGGSSHGVYVSGLAAARTNNAKGIASAGFYTKFLPVKINDSTGVLLRAYEGIVYAADHGCSVINCSWGGQTPHPFGEDMINYATYNKDALVVAAAGNFNNQAVLYPASFENVISVAGTTINDEKWTPQNSGTTGGSSYGIFVDVCAPGANVYTTKNNSYDFGWGTSFASPIVASCAALLKKWYGDTVNAIQLGEILRMTCDNIDTIPGNMPYAGLLGGGRVNLYKALLFRDQTDSLPPSVRFIDYHFISQGSNFTKPGDTIVINGNYINYLYPSHSLSAEVSTENQHAHFIDSVNYIGQINTLQQVNNLSSPFRFYIDEQANYDEEVTFKIHFTDSLYDYNQYFKSTLNPSYADIDTNHIRLTLTSNGKIGYNNYYPLQGNGLEYNHGGSLLYEGGLAIAQSSQKVSRSFLNQNDYKILKGLRPVVPSAPADERWTSEFSDSLAGSAMLGLSVKLDAMEWTSQNKSDFVILNYTLINNNSNSLTDIYSGIYLDWDIANSIRNKTFFNSESRLSYSWYTGQTNLYAGVKLLTPVNGFHYAFDVTETGNGGINIYDGISNAELFEALTTNRNEAGASANGNEIATLVSYGPLQIAAHDSVVLSYALLASNSLYNLDAGATEAQAIYDSLYISAPINYLQSNSFFIFPNPSPGEFNLYIKSEKAMKSDFEIFNMLGETVLKKYLELHQGKNIIPVVTDFEKGIYLIHINSSEYASSIRLVIK